MASQLLDTAIPSSMKRFPSGTNSQNSPQPKQVESYRHIHEYVKTDEMQLMCILQAPEDMELNAFALSKMVQVVELSGVLDLKALKRWNGAWSAIILGYM
ncbi:MAG: hypothetical protein BYD32DRAFT_463628 [Podila humilis]|nr:MAG: hypothetical protein BYD32DRAFT_463628 [Podila humilis]